MANRQVIYIATTVSLLTSWGIATPGLSTTTFLYVQSASGDWVGQGVTQLFTPADGLFIAHGISSYPAYFTSVNAVKFHFVGKKPGLLSNWQLIFSAPENTTLLPGIYEGATHWQHTPLTNPGLNVDSDNRGCDTLSGRFTVLEAVYSSSGMIKQFAADFEQFCEDPMPPLYGQVRFNSSIETPPTPRVPEPVPESVPEPTAVLGLLGLMNLMFTKLRRSKRMHPMH